VLLFIWGVLTVLLGGAALSDGLWNRWRARGRGPEPETRSWFVDLAGAIFLCAGVYVLHLAVLRWSTPRTAWLVAVLGMVFLGNFVFLWRREYRLSAPVVAWRLKPWQRVLAVVAGAMMIVTAVYLGIRPVHYRFMASRTAGTVIAHYESHDPESGDFMDPREIVRFTPAGGTSIDFVDRESSNEIVNVGETVEVLYFPDDPAAAIIDRGLWDLFIDAGIALFGVLVITIGVAPLGYKGHVSYSDDA
jgi:Protein of unknown function (DUF3592)